MALTPAEDKTAFWKRIRSDPWMEKSLNLVGASDAQATAVIRKSRTVDDAELNGDKRFVLIFDPPSEDAGMAYEKCCIEVDVLTPLSAQDWADSKLTQVIALCGERWSVNGKPIVRVVRTGALTAAAGFYRCGARFYYYSSTITQVKTL